MRPAAAHHTRLAHAAQENPMTSAAHPEPHKDTQQWEGLAWSDLAVGMYIRWSAPDRGFGGMGIVTRSGYVRKVTAKTAEVLEDGGTPRRINRSTFYEYETQRLTDKPARAPQLAQVEIDRFVPSRRSNFERSDYITITVDGKQVQTERLPFDAPRDLTAELRRMGWELVDSLTEAAGPRYLVGTVRRAPAGPV